MTPNTNDHTERDRLLEGFGVPVEGEPDTDHSISLRRLQLDSFDEQLPVFLTRLRDTHGRWILIAEYDNNIHFYTQFLVYEDGLIHSECVSNESQPGTLSANQNTALSRLRWKKPEPPAKPNWWHEDDSAEAPQTSASLASRTIHRVFGVNTHEFLLVKLFRSSLDRNNWDGVSPWKIDEWKSAGFDGPSAAAWTAQGYFDPKDAATLVSSGVTLEDASAWASNGWYGPDMARIVKGSNVKDLRAGRWNSLLSKWYLGSVAYLLERGFSISEVDKWATAGLSSPALVEEAIAAGGTAQAAARLMQNGIPPDAVPPVIKAQLGLNEVRKWAALNLDAMTMRTLLNEHATANEVRRLISLGATPPQLVGLPFSRITYAQAVKWVAANTRYTAEDYLAIGVDSPSLAIEWEQEGFAPSLIKGFVATGMDPKEAASKVRDGFTDQDCLNGVLVPPLRGTSWREVLPRSRASDADFVLSPSASADCHARFWYAVECLSVSTDYHGTMFASSYRWYQFADGGLVDVSGYGWGSHSGTWINGTKVLRLICGRMGLTQPRLLKGESQVPNLDDLEAELRSERACHS
jgi:hypothetical protein